MDLIKTNDGRKRNFICISLWGIQSVEANFGLEDLFIGAKIYAVLCDLSCMASARHD